MVQTAAIDGYLVIREDGILIHADIVIGHNVSIIGELEPDLNALGVSWNGIRTQAVDVAGYVALTPIHKKQQFFGGRKRNKNKGKIGY